MRNILINCLLFSSLSFGQSTLAKIKFEQAEIAYNEGKYNESLNFLSETEVLLKGSNTTIIYLQILAQNKLLESSEGVNYSVLKSIRENCDYYLISADGISDLEVKFKEVYFISENLKKYPTNELDFQEFINDRLQKKKQDEFFALKATMAGVSIGMTLEEIPLEVWNTIDRKGFDYDSDNKSFTNYSKKIDLSLMFASAPSSNVVGLNNLIFKRPDQTVFSVSQILESGNNLKKDVILQNFNTKCIELNKEYGEINVVRDEADQKNGRVKTNTKTASVIIDQKLKYTLTYIVSTSGITVSVFLTESISAL